MAASIEYFALTMTTLSWSVAHPRADVTITGTTVGPGFFRPEGKLSPRCPATHPIAFDNGLHCCKFPMKTDDPISDECDGSLMKYGDTDLRCCYKQSYVQCQDDENRPCVSPKGTEVLESCSNPTPTMLSSDPVKNPSRHAGKVLVYRECEDHYSYLLASEPGYGTNYKFVVDLGCEATITNFKVRNSRNQDFNDRSTKDFTIEASTDQTSWELVLSKTLPSAIDLDACLIPIQEYKVQAYARYLRYTLINFHGTGSVALNYITWEFFKL